MRERHRRREAKERRTRVCRMAERRERAKVLVVNRMEAKKENYIKQLRGAGEGGRVRGGRWHRFPHVQRILMHT